MAINFPSSPANGDTYTYGGKTWTYDGTATKWLPLDEIDISNYTGDVNITGALTATSFTGDGSSLTNLPASGGVIVATADGALTEGDKVIIQSDGTVKRVTQTTAAVDMSITAGEEVFSSEESIGSLSVKPDDPTIFIACTFSGKIIMCKNTAGVISVLATGSSGVSRYLRGVFNPTHPNNFITIEEFNGYIRNKVFSVDSVAGTLTEEDNIQTSTDIFEIFSAKVYMDGSTLYAVGDKHTNNIHAVLSGDFSTANTARSSWTVTQYSTTAGNNAGHGLAVNDGVILKSLTKTSAPYYCNLTVNYGANYTSLVSDSVHPYLEPCIGQAGKFLITYNLIHSGQETYIRLVTVVNNDITLSEPVQVLGSIVPYGLSVDADDPTKAIISYRGYVSNANYRTLDIDYTTSTIKLSEPFVVDGSTADMVTYSGSSNKFYTINYNGTVENAYVLTASASAVTNLSSSNFLGISDEAYADADAAKIKVVGAVSDSQSSLTVGSKHYVQPDNTLGTTAADPEVYAGLALSATELLIKG